MKLKITILEGDGIGPEVTREAVRVLHAIATLHGHEFCFEQKLIGGAAIRQTGSPLPAARWLHVSPVMRCYWRRWLTGIRFADSPNRPEAGLLLLRRGLEVMRSAPAISYDEISAASPLRLRSPRREYSDSARVAGRSLFRRAARYVG